MSNSLTLDRPVPGDPSSRALGIGLRKQDVEEVLRPGLKIVQQALESLAANAGEILAEIDDSKNSLVAKGLVFVKVGRKVDEQLLKEGKLKVIDCDNEKILALIAALTYEGSERARELRGIIMENLVKGGIPLLQVEREPKVSGSIHIHILDQCLELKLQRPA